MPASKSRYVTACQQLLALAVVLAVLTPAASVVTLDVVHTDPGSATIDVAVEGGEGGALAAYSAAAGRPSLVPTAPVDATVEEVPLTGATSTAPARRAAARVATRGGHAKLVSTPQDVTGYGTIGITWAHGTRVPDDEIGFQFRMREHGGWSGWRSMVYHDEHAPEPGTREARRARPGTDEMVVGNVDQVQVKVTSGTGSLPTDMKLAVVDPGVAVGEERERAAIDTATLDGDAPQPSTTAGDDALELRAASFTPKPTIYSRAQWGANEKLRTKGSLHYYEVHAGFVHHTVNANKYTRAEVPGILRSIYAYHTRSRGWSDIGYNYLVDRFGRIWEGRAGGVDRPVVGAHTLGYNDYSFAMSAIGNFDIARPSDAMIQAYGALFAWKLSLHGVSAASTAQVVGSKTFQAINGHRDAGSTACPGKYLYARIPDIRALAATAQRDWSGRELESDLAGSPQPDLVARRAADGRLFVLPLQVDAAGTPSLGTAVDTGTAYPNADQLLNAGDWDRDGFGDVITRARGKLFVRYGDGTGRLTRSQRLSKGFAQVTLLAAVGDMTGDGFPDLMGQQGKSMMIWPGLGPKGLGAPYAAHSRITASRQIGIGRWDADGSPDTLVTNGRTLQVYAGNGPGGLTTASTVAGVDLAPYDWVVGVHDVGLTGHADLVVRTRGTGQLSLLPGETTGVGAPVPLGAGTEMYDLVG